MSKKKHKKSSSSSKSEKRSTNRSHSPQQQNTASNNTTKVKKSSKSKKSSTTTTAETTKPVINNPTIQPVSPQLSLISMDFSTHKKEEDSKENPTQLIKTIEPTPATKTTSIKSFSIKKVSSTRAALVAAPSPPITKPIKTNESTNQLTINEKPIISTPSKSQPDESSTHRSSRHQTTNKTATTHHTSRSRSRSVRSSSKSRNRHRKHRNSSSTRRRSSRRRRSRSRSTQQTTNKNNQIIKVSSSRRTKRSLTPHKSTSSKKTPPKPVIEINTQIISTEIVVVQPEPVVKLELTEPKIQSQPSSSRQSYRRTSSSRYSSSKYHATSIQTSTQPPLSSRSTNPNRSHHRKRRKYSSSSRNRHNRRRSQRSYSRSRSHTSMSGRSRSPNAHSFRSSSRSSSYSSTNSTGSSYSSRSRKYSINRLEHVYDENAGRSSAISQQTTQQFSNRSSYSSHNHHSSSRFHTQNPTSFNNNRSSTYFNSNSSYNQRFNRSGSGLIDPMNSSNPPSTTNSTSEEYQSIQMNQSNDSLFNNPIQRRLNSLRQIKIENNDPSNSYDYYRNSVNTFRPRQPSQYHQRKNIYFSGPFNAQNTTDELVHNVDNQLNLQQQQFLAQIDSEPLIHTKIDRDEECDDYLSETDSVTSNESFTNQLLNKDWSILNEFSLTALKTDLTLFDIVFKNKLTSLCSDLNDGEDAQTNDESINLTEHIVKLINLNNDCDDDLNLFRFFDSSNTANKSNSLIYFILSNCLLSKSFSKIKLNRLFNSNCDENCITPRATCISRDLARRSKRIDLLNQKQFSVAGYGDVNGLENVEEDSVLSECLTLLQNENLI